MGSQPEPRIEIGGRKVAEEIVCYVKDNGVGIDPRHHEKIFGLFNKLDQEHVGTGIGLALVYLFRRSSYSDPQKSPRPRLILLDLRLPKIDGLEVLKEIRASDELKKTPVVILTTSNAERDAARAYEEHASSYLVKPLGGQKLVQLMKDIGFYWLGWNYYPWE